MKCPFIVNTVVTEKATPKIHREPSSTDPEMEPYISIHWETSKLYQQIMTECQGSACVAWSHGKCLMLGSNFESEFFDDEQEDENL